MEPPNLGPLPQQPPQPPTQSTHLPPHQEYPGSGFAGPTHQPIPEPTMSSSNIQNGQFLPQQDIPSQQQQQQQQYQESYNYTNDYNDDDVQFGSPQAGRSKLFRAINLRYQHFLDVITPHKTGRWAFAIFTLFVFMLRIMMSQGWYVICYGLSIYYLNLFIAFLSPKIDPAFAAADNYYFDSGEPMLPTTASDEFKPFIRRLPEFKFWLSATTATLISLFLTLFDLFDLPVFWPILLLYFILLFVSTMRQQIRHMIKYGYVPWDKGKKRYGGQSDNI